MSASATYDLVNSRLQRAWGTLYLVIGHDEALPLDLKERMARAIGPNFDYAGASLSLQTIPAGESPVKSDTKSVTYIKWPLKYRKGPITSEIEGIVRGNLRSNFNRDMVSAGYAILQTDFKAIIGQELTGDQGIPPSPEPPLADVPIWPAAILGSLLGPAMYLSQK